MFFVRIFSIRIIQRNFYVVSNILRNLFSLTAYLHSPKNTWYSLNSFINCFLNLFCKLNKSILLIDKYFQNLLLVFYNCILLYYITCFDFSVMRFYISFYIFFIVCRLTIKFYFDTIADFFQISYVSSNSRGFIKKTYIKFHQNLFYMHSVLEAVYLKV